LISSSARRIVSINAWTSQSLVDPSFFSNEEAKKYCEETRCLNALGYFASKANGIDQCHPKRQLLKTDVVKAPSTRRDESC